MVGGMGHSGSVSLGVSLQTKSNVICLDGDGSLIMHLGSTISNGFFEKKILSIFCLTIILTSLLEAKVQTLI